MPRYEATTEFAFPVEQVFAVLQVPSGRVALVPPDLQVRLLAGPKTLAVGSRLTVETRRMGLTFRIVSEIAQFEPNARIVEVQKEGPLAAWTQTQLFTTLPGGRTRLHDRIDYELPGGLMGMFVTAAMVEREVRAGLAHRNRSLAEQLARAAAR